MEVVHDKHLIMLSESIHLHSAWLGEWAQLGYVVNP